MSELSSLLKVITGTAVIHIRTQIESKITSNAFDAYLSYLSPSINRYRHHLNKETIDLKSLKSRFEHETAFIQILCAFLERSIKIRNPSINANLSNSICSYFHWYVPNSQICALISAIPEHLLLKADIETDTATLINDVLNQVSERYVGEFYTPLPIAKHLVDISGFSPADFTVGSRVVDPACGAGIILSEVYKRAIEHSINYNIASEEVLRWFKYLVNGFDIQPFAVSLTRAFLQYTIATSLLQLPQNINLSSYVRGIQLVDPLAKSLYFWQRQRKFRYVIGNPPYLHAKKKYLDYIENFSPILNGHPNLYQMFIWWAINSVSEGGRIAFLIPQSILVGPYYQNLREQIDQKAKLIQLTRMLDRKGVVGSADQQLLAIGLETGTSSSISSVGIKVSRNGYDIEKAKEIYVNQAKVVQRLSNHLFWLVSESNLDYEIAEIVKAKTKTMLEMQDILEIGNGSFVWNEHKSILSAGDYAEAIPLISAASIKVGDFIFPYSGNHKAKLRAFAQVTDKTRSKLTSGSMVLIKRTTPSKAGRRLIVGLITEEFAHTYPNFFLENHVIFIRVHHINLINGLIGWLNSDLINFIFQMRNGTPHTSVAEIQNLPVNLRVLQALTSQLSWEGNLPAEVKNRQLDNVNRTVFNWLDLDTRHRKRIREVLLRKEKGD